MPANGSTLLGQLLQAFLFTLTGGYARTVADVYWLLAFLATIELIMAATTWYLAGHNLLGEVAWKILGFSFLFVLVDNWQTWMKALMNSFIDMGLLIGDSAVTRADITDPGNLIDFGLSLTAVLTNKVGRLSLLTNGHIVIFGGLCGWLIALLFTLMAVHVFTAILEYYIVGACLLILVPFMAYQKTAALGDGVFGTFVSHAMRLLIYATVISISLPVLYTWRLPADPVFRDVWLLFSGALTAFSVVVSAPQLAMGMHRGAGVFTWSTLLFGASSLAQTAAAVGAVGAAGSVAGAGALRGAVSGASAMREAAHLGAESYRSTHPGAGAGGAMLGGAQGMGTYAVSRLTSGVRAAVQSGRIRAQNTMP